MTASSQTRQRARAHLAALGDRATPWAVALLRLATAQTLLLANLGMMMHADGLRSSLSPGWWADEVVKVASSGPGHVVAALCPLLLAAGLAARPASVALLIEVLLLPPAGPSPTLVWPLALALVTVATLGPGALALDRLFGVGLAHSALPGGRAMMAATARLGRFGTAPILLLMRLALAAALIDPSVPVRAMGGVPVTAAPIGPLPHGLLITGIAALLVSGLATRAVALALLFGLLAVQAHGLHAGSATPATLGLFLAILALRGGGTLALDALAVGLFARGEVRHDGLPHVVILGAGFGGTAAARALRRSPCRVTLIDRQNHHLFQPLLYQVATATLSPADIATPIRTLFRDQDNLAVLLGEVMAVDRASRTVSFQAKSVPYDFLVVATGAEHSYFGHDAWRSRAPGLKTLADATAIRARILSAFEAAESTDDEVARASLLCFVVVGGGPTGVEIAGAIAELAHLGLDAEYRSSDPRVARIVLVHSGDRLLPAFPETLGHEAERSLRGLGVEVVLSARAEPVDDGVKINGTVLPTRTIVWGAGVKASPAARWLGVAADNAGRVPVGPDLRLADDARVFVIGDTAASTAWNGAPVPGLAPAAKQGGHYAARAIDAHLRRRRAPAPFRYRHYGSLATIGRQSAVAAFGPLRLRGTLAWWLWGLAHVAFLVGNRNRVGVLLEWFWSYLTLRRGTRLIIRSFDT